MPNSHASERLGFLHNKRTCVAQAHEELRVHGPLSERHPYEAMPAWLVRRTLEALPIDPRDFVFVDLGAGKGRALMIA